jgi:hypothetical protein
MIHTVLPLLSSEQESGLDVPWFITTEHADDTLRKTGGPKEPGAVRLQLESNPSERLAAPMLLIGVVLGVYQRTLVVAESCPT